MPDEFTLTESSPHQVAGPRVSITLQVSTVPKGAEGTVAIEYWHPRFGWTEAARFPPITKPGTHELRLNLPKPAQKIRSKATCLRRCRECGTTTPVTGFSQFVTGSSRT